MVALRYLEYIQYYVCRLFSAKQLYVLYNEKHTLQLTRGSPVTCRRAGCRPGVLVTSPLRPHPHPSTFLLTPSLTVPSPYHILHRHQNSKSTTPSTLPHHPLQPHHTTKVLTNCSYPPTTSSPRILSSVSHRQVLWDGVRPFKLSLIPGSFVKNRVRYQIMELLIITIKP